MNKAKLLLFIKRILENGSNTKSSVSLYQLKTILETQHADAELIKLVDQTMNSIPEAKDAVKEINFSEKDLQTAIERAKERIRREESMRRDGRC